MRNVLSLAFVIASSLLAFVPIAQAEDDQFAVVDSRLKTPFRYYSVVATDVARNEDGSLVYIDPVNPRLALDKKTGEWVRASINHFGGTPRAKEYRLFPAKEIVHSPLPNDDWMTETYEDYNWARMQGGAEMRVNAPEAKVGAFEKSDLMSKYKSLATIKLRSRFHVVDPNKVGDLTLHLQYRGGVVVYVNGKELGRYHLPDGPLTWKTCAEDYPKEVYFKTGGGLLMQSPQGWKLYRNYSNFSQMKRWVKEDWEKLANRSRVQRLTIPASFLKEGVNVLAVGLHRSAAIPEMFTTPSQVNGRHTIHPHRLSYWWNRVSLESMVLYAANSAKGSVLPNVDCPDKLVVANHPVTQPVFKAMYSDPYEKVGPIEIQAMPQGSHAGAVIASSLKTIKNLSVTIDDLTGEGGTISKSHVQVLYQKLDGPARIGYSITPGERLSYFDSLDTYAPKEITKQVLTPLEAKKGVKQPSFVIQPIWFLVKVPADAKAGLYKGIVRISCEGNEEVKVPLELTVVGDWKIPKPADTKMFVVLDQSPETLAIKYKVPLWSDQHWKLIEDSLDLLGQLGNKEILITFTSKTYAGNENAMLYFERDASGNLQPNFSIVDKYIGLAAKHMGHVPSVCTIVNYGAGIQRTKEDGHYGGPPKAPQRVTVFDPASNTFKDELVPDWGTPEALTFWKPVFDKYIEIMKKHKVGPVPVIYWTQFAGVNKQCYADLQKIVPGIMHMNRSHIKGEREKKIGKGLIGKRLYCSLVASGGSGVHWDPDYDEPYYGWRQPLNILTVPREGTMGKSNAGMLQNSYQDHFRSFPEQTVLTGVGGPRGLNLRHRGYYNRRGYGQFGADFWPVALNPDKPDEHTRLVDRYYGESSTTPDIQSILGPGQHGPVITARYQMLREGWQDAEARMFITDAILDKKDSLSEELLAKAKRICDQHTRQLRYFVEFTTYGQEMPQLLLHKSKQMFLLADEIKKALNGK